MASALFDVLEDPDLLAVERAIDVLLERFRQPQDRVERRAQFVAHAGQELIFEAGGARQFGVGGAQVGGSLGDSPRQQSAFLL
jgi:hypothetical protein